jgi:Domain of unknown function DUF29
MRTQQTKSSYDKDFFLWSRTQAELLRKKDFSKADLENIIEEIESLSRRDKWALASQTERLLHHLLKLHYTPENKGNSKSWEGSIRTSKDHICRLLKESPSLKNELKKIFKNSYDKALELAIFDSCHAEHLFPKECPWTIEEVLK